MDKHTRATVRRLKNSLSYVNKRIRKNEENLVKSYKERREIEELLEKLRVDPTFIDGKIKSEGSQKNLNGGL